MVVGVVCLHAGRWTTIMNMNIQDCLLMKLLMFEKLDECLSLDISISLECLVLSCCIYWML